MSLAFTSINRQCVQACDELVTLIMSGSSLIYDHAPAMRYVIGCNEFVIIMHMFVRAAMQYCYNIYFILLHMKPPFCVAGRVTWAQGFGRRAFTVLRSTCSCRVTIYVGKPPAAGQPTRPTQPFILSGSIN